MAHVRRNKHVSHHGVMNVTDLDDELEEFSLGTVEYKPPVNRDSRVSVNESFKPPANRDSRMSVNGKETNGQIKPDTGDQAHRHVTAKTHYKDPLKSPNYSDPLRSQYLDPLKQNNRASLPKKQSDSKDHQSLTSRSNGSISTHAQQKEILTSPGSSGSNTSQSPAQRGVRATALQQRNTVSSIHGTRNYNSVQNTNKNQKGFGREERDLFIDDLEDF